MNDSIIIDEGQAGILRPTTKTLLVRLALQAVSKKLGRQTRTAAVLLPFTAAATVAAVAAASTLHIGLS